MHPQNLGSVVILIQGMRVTEQKWATKSESSFSREKVLKKEATNMATKKAAKKAAKKKKK